MARSRIALTLGPRVMGGMRALNWMRLGNLMFLLGSVLYVVAGFTCPGWIRNQGVYRSCLAIDFIAAILYLFNPLAYFFAGWLAQLDLNDDGERHKSDEEIEALAGAGADADEDAPPLLSGASAGQPRRGDDDGDHSSDLMDTFADSRIRVRERGVAGVEREVSETVARVSILSEADALDLLWAEAPLPAWIPNWIDSMDHFFWSNVFFLLPSICYTVTASLDWFAPGHDTLNFAFDLAASHLFVLDSIIGILLWWKRRRAGTRWRLLTTDPLRVDWAGWGDWGFVFGSLLYAMDSYICQYLSGELCNIILMIAAWLFLFDAVMYFLSDWAASVWVHSLQNTTTKSGLELMPVEEQ